MKKQWMNPEVSNLAVEATQSQELRGTVSCDCCEGDKFIGGNLADNSKEEIGANLLAHKTTVHGYKGTDGFVKVCTIS